MVKKIRERQELEELRARLPDIDFNKDCKDLRLQDKIKQLLLLHGLKDTDQKDIQEDGNKATNRKKEIGPQEASAKIAKHGSRCCNSYLLEETVMNQRITLQLFAEHTSIVKELMADNKSLQNEKNKLAEEKRAMEEVNTYKKPS